ncbi:RrF2 family transcriptional regulator [Actinoplanes sp. NPDC000266]
MRMSKGVEWAVHTLINLSLLDSDRARVGQLAAAHELPEAYLTKQLQHLVRAGLLVSTAGPQGGYSLARPVEEITLRDVVEAIEGPAPVFHCAEIRRCGRIGEFMPPSDGPCAVKVAMHRAETAWRDALGAESLGRIRTELYGKPGVTEVIRAAFLF